LLLGIATLLWVTTLGRPVAKTVRCQSMWLMPMELRVKSPLLRVLRLTASVVLLSRHDCSASSKLSKKIEVGVAKMRQECRH
jgi:hypothetical protein